MADASISCIICLDGLEKSNPEVKVGEKGLMPLLNASKKMQEKKNWKNTLRQNGIVELYAFIKRKMWRKMHSRSSRKSLTHHNYWKLETGNIKVQR